MNHHTPADWRDALSRARSAAAGDALGRLLPSWALEEHRPWRALARPRLAAVRWVLRGSAPGRWHPLRRLRAKHAVPQRRWWHDLAGSRCAAPAAVRADLAFS